MASVIDKINDYNAGISAPLQELKWKALKESRFRFFRGTCHLFARDFVKMYNYKPKVKTWICGDLHFENFGSYKGENRQVYFDLCDFDEAILASPEPEMARFLTSIIIASADMKVSGIGLHKTLHDIMDAFITTVTKGKALMLEQAVAHGTFKKYFEKVETFDRQTFITERTVKEKGVLRLKPDGVHFLSIEEERKTKIFEAVNPLLEENPRFQHLVFEDVGFRIAGTGSLGLERYCMLCYSKKKGKRFLIDIKESRNSCYTGLTDVKQPKFNSEAERVNMIGFIMQFNSPAFMSTVQIDDKWYMVKELQLQSDKMKVTDFGTDFGHFSDVAIEMGTLMAYAQLRSCGRLGASKVDDLIKFAEKKQWQRDIIEVSAELSRKNTKYYKEFLKVE